MNLPSMAYIKPSMIVRPFENTEIMITENRKTQKKKQPSNPIFAFFKNIFRVGDTAQSIKSMFSGPLSRVNFNTSRIARVNWKIWILGFFIYSFIIFCANLSDFDELLTEEDHSSLIEWVQENEGVLRTEHQLRGNLAHDTCDEYDVYVSQDEYSHMPGAQQQLDYSDWLALKRVNWNYMYYVPSQDLVYCKVPKSGSSTWVYNLLKLAHVPEETLSSDIGLHKVLRDYYPKMSSTKMKRVFKRSFKFMVVRHPFDRILSAYRDKLEDYQRDLRFRDGYYYTMYGKNMVRVYRDQNDVSLANRTEPTWQEFIKYLINTPATKFDEHWKPIYMLCSPCVTKYDVIAKMETFSEDTQYIINQLGLEDNIQVEWIHRTSKSKTSEVAKTYFSQLSGKQIDNLYAKYHLDFELFGYTYDAYREIAEST